MTPFMNRCRALVLALGVIAVGSEARAQASLPAGFRDQPIVGGLRYPTGFAFLPDGRCLFVEQLSGRVRLIVNGVIASTDPVCTIPDVQQRRLGARRLRDRRRSAMAEPALRLRSLQLERFAAPGEDHAVPRRRAILAFTGNGALTIDPATRYELFSDLYDAAHNGGTLRFGPDQMLYASVGDSFTTPCAAQHLASLRGVVLRLEVRNLPPGSGARRRDPARAARQPLRLGSQPQRAARLGARVPQPVSLPHRPDRRSPVRRRRGRSGLGRDRSRQCGRRQLRLAVVRRARSVPVVRGSLGQRAHAADLRVRQRRRSAVRDRRRSVSPAATGALSIPARVRGRLLLQRPLPQVPCAG